MPKAKAAALKALEIDDRLAEAHVSVAFANFLYDWDWQAAGQHFVHDGETRRGWLVRTGQKYELVQRRPNGFVIVNREKFHQALVQEIRSYLRNLSNPLERELRKNLIRAMNDLCARSRPKL